MMHYKEAAGRDWFRVRSGFVDNLCQPAPNKSETMRKTLCCIFFLGCLATWAASAQEKSKETFDARALFQPGMSTMQAARETCAKGPGAEFGKCFVQQMQAAGASPQAVAFMHAIQNNGFMRDFVDAGRVSIAFADFPFAANENQHAFLVNGKPSVIDVDDYAVIPRNDLSKDPEYAALLKKFPNLSVFPGDRAGTQFITAKALPNGGQRFLVPYVLVDGCHACARVAKLALAFDFDKEGKFLGAKVANVHPTA